MVTFEHKVKDPHGMHARPAGLLAREAQKYASEIKVTKGEKSADMKGVFSLMSLTVKSGDIITVTISGSDEKTAAENLSSYIRDNI